MDALRRSRPSYGIVYRYIAGEYLISFTVSFLFFFSIFFINQLLLLAEEILTKNVAFTDVALLIVYSMPAIITFTFPFSSLVGALMAVGRLSADNEILAFRAAGISYRHLFIPFIAAGLLFSIFSFIAGDYFLPRGTIAFGRLYREILFANPALEFEPHSVHSYGGTTFITGSVHERSVENMVIIDSAEGGERRVIVTDEATIGESEEQQGVVSLTLNSVTGHSVPTKRRDDYDYFEAERMHYNILLRSMSFSISSLTPREMGSLDVYHEIVQKREDLEEKKAARKKEAAERGFSLEKEYYRFLSSGEGTPPPALTALSERLASIEELENRPLYDRSLNNHILEFHKKIAIPFGSLAFVFFAFPLAGITKKSGRAVGFGLGLFVSVIYWAMLFAGQTLGLRMYIDPALAMWIPNILIVLTGLVLYRIRSRT
ncbi:MAG: LptF/LptG family permease [Sediminispirochaetaceae bacterium]